jgi:hypothetical protein
VKCWAQPLSIKYVVLPALCSPLFFFSCVHSFSVGLFGFVSSPKPTGEFRRILAGFLLTPCQFSLWVIRKIGLPNDIVNFVTLQL